MYMTSRSDSWCFVGAFLTTMHQTQRTIQVLAALTAAGVAFCISTTSPKPRVPASITACKLDEYFPADKVSGRLVLVIFCCSRRG